MQLITQYYASRKALACDQLISQPSAFLFEADMTKISIFYPNTDGARFDFDYYLNTHMPL